MLFIEVLKSRLDIVAVARDRGFPLELRDEGALIRCPLFSYPRPVLYLSRKTGQWACFDCRKNGDVVQFVQELDGGPRYDIARELWHRYFSGEPLPRAPWEAPR